MLKVLAFPHTMNDDDDVDFKPSQSTRPRTSDNQSLIYTAPKAPKTGESSAPSADSSPRILSNEKLDIITTRNVQAHKFEDGKYINQGTAGLAIIGSFEWHIYQIILYKNKKEYLSKTHVSPNFSFTVLENNYASFYDNARQNWSILFLSSADVEGFAKQVAIARYNSQAKPNKVLVQDLLPSGTAKAKKKDIVKVNYSCSILQNDEIIPLEENMRVSVELAETNIFPWHEGVKYCSEQCKRVVITPYKLSAPWMNDIEPNCSLLIELEVESITPPDSSVASGQKQKEKTAETKVQDETQTDSSADEDNCREKGTSIIDSLFLSRSHKANLLSRIAKMGQALPLKGAFVSGPSDSEEESTSPCRRVNRLRAIGNAVQQFHQSVPMALRPCSPRHADEMNAPSQAGQGVNSPVYKADMSWQQQQVRSGINFACQQLCPFTTGPQASICGHEADRNQQLPEPATMDSELRISINKVSQKVDHVLNKLQNLNAGSSWDRMKEHQSATVLDPVSVISSIQGVIAENENLKDEISKQKSKIDEQNKKIETLLDLTQKCVEQCSLPDGRRFVDAGRIAELEKRLVSSDQLMIEANTRMNQLASDAERYRNEISENQKLIRESKVQVEGLVEKLREKEKLLESMEVELVRTVSENEALMSVNEEQKMEIMRYKSHDLGESSGTSREPQYASSEESFEEIKRIMNVVNKKLQSYFDSEKQYSGSEVKDTIATTIKEVTVEYLRYKSRQKSASKVDIQQREGGKLASEVRKESVRSRAESIPQSQNWINSSKLAYNDDSRVDKSRKSSDIGKVGSHRLTFLDHQGSQSQVAALRDRPGERVAAEDIQRSKLDARKISETSEHVTPQMSTRTIAESKLDARKISEASEHVTPQTSTRTIAESNEVPQILRSGSIVDRENEMGSEGVRETSVGEKSLSEIAKESSTFSPPHRLTFVDGGRDDGTVEDSAVEIEKSSAAPSEVLTSSARASVSQPASRRSTTGHIISRQVSGGGRGTTDDLGHAAEPESFREYDETENVETENSAVNLSKTTSIVTKDSDALSYSQKSLFSARDNESEVEKSGREGSAATGGGVEPATEEKGNGDEEIEEFAETPSSSAPNAIRSSLNRRSSYRSSALIEEQASGAVESVQEDYGEDVSEVQAGSEEYRAEDEEAEKPLYRLNTGTLEVAEDVKAESSSETPLTVIQSQNSRIYSNIREDSSARTSTMRNSTESGTVEVKESTTAPSKAPSLLSKNLSNQLPSHRSTVATIGRISEVAGAEDVDDVTSENKMRTGSEEESPFNGNSNVEVSALVTNDTSTNLSRAVDASQSSSHAPSVSANSKAIETDEIRAIPSVRSSASVTSESRDISGTGGHAKRSANGIDEVNEYGGTEGAETESQRVTLEGRVTEAPSKRTSALIGTDRGSDADKSGVVSKAGEEEDGGESAKVTSESLGSKGQSNYEEMATEDDEAEGDDDTEKRSISEKDSSSVENIRKTGSNSVYDSVSDYDSYYQSWGSSKPPPLPPADEESDSEEWL